MPIMGTEEPIAVYELRLQDDGSPSDEKKYVRLPPPEKPYILRFSLEAGSSASHHGSLWTNLPQGGAGNDAFERGKFYEHVLPDDLRHSVTMDVLIAQPGAFEYYVEHAASSTAKPYPTVEEPFLPDATKVNDDNSRVQSKHGFFVVDPVLHVPSRSRILAPDGTTVLSASEDGGKVQSQSHAMSQDGIVLQSFMAKWAGSISEWAPHLEEASRNGYNMLHFLPLQVRGKSNSPYSIGEQLDFARDLFDAKTGASSTREERAQTVARSVKAIKDQYGILSMIDVVLNHTANSSEWLYEHPEAAYSPYNSPHLVPAEELDRALYEYSNKLASLGLPTDLKSESDADAIIAGVPGHVLKPLQLWEYYVINTLGQKDEFSRTFDNDSGRTVSSLGTDNLREASLKDVDALLERHALRNRMSLDERFTTHVDISVAVSIFKGILQGKLDKATAVSEFGNALDRINAPLYALYDDDVKAIVSNLEGRLKYMRLQEGGPKMGPITPESPFCEDYFTRLNPNHPSAQKHDPRALALANNGWIWAADPLMDFASSKSRVYLRREVISWGDCVKLRYGSEPSESPWLWNHMSEYCRLQASLFDGFRIDNCHSTPLHVGSHMLDVARKANPNLYVCAELFTGSEAMDTLFVSKLGINSLIREMENGHDPKEESRLLYRFGVNKPIGSMDTDCLSRSATVSLPEETGGTQRQCTITQLAGSMPHALFMDVTHDNETPSRKRTTEDAITMAALVAFSWSAIGSTKGFDDLYPDQLNVVTEKRRYEAGNKSDDVGIGAIKRVFNHLHQEMVADGYSEGHVHQEGDYLIMHRIHPQTHRGYLVVTHTRFSSQVKGRGSVNPFRLNRTQVKYIMGKTLKILGGELQTDPELIHGVPSKLVDIPEPSTRKGSDDDGPFTEIVVPDEFPPASVMLFSTSMDGLGSDLDSLCTSGAQEAMAGLSLVDLNVMLYRADAEERDATDGQDGAYTIPELGPLVYCGLEGWIAHLKRIMQTNDLGHPICAHLRAGPWALDFVHQRLEKQVQLFPQLRKPAAWLRERMEKIKGVCPSFLRPKYFSLVVKTAYEAARQCALQQMSNFVKQGDEFTRNLALCAVQMNGQVKSSSLWHDRPSASMAAGLPFFATSWARLWGRDVFISLRGLYLTTAMQSAAREHILSFGSTLKHGMIPNLLNSTTLPRYNCRDGPWFFAQNVQDYVNKTPDGTAILTEKVKRRFPLDDEWVPVESPRAFAHESTVAEIIQEILQRHASGIHFREYNAGPNIDGDMTDNGFNIDVVVDWETGFVLGGNKDNCGTWQDKMGSSAKAGNKGVPGSPREGAAVEITGLVMSTLRWIDQLAEQGIWPARGVNAHVDGNQRLVTYKEWADLIRAAFEKHYWIPLNPKDDAEYAIDSRLVNRRGIYKDVYGSSKGREWCDYQLRANFAVAMCVAPELFDTNHARTALQAQHNALGDVLGMKTLDPRDRNFHPVYDNSNDTSDFWMAKGFCYHNGPPWVFPFGFHLRAALIMAARSGASSQDRGKSEMRATAWRVMGLLIPHRQHMESSPWAGLPELTNADGVECSDSCPTQAWSASTILDALELIHEQEAL